MSNELLSFIMNSLNQVISKAEAGFCVVDDQKGDNGERLADAVYHPNGKPLLKRVSWPHCPGGTGASGSGPVQLTSPRSLQGSSRLKGAVCALLPSGRAEGVSGSLGALGAVGGGGELLLNYDTGQISAFGEGSVQAGWNGGASATVYSGFVYGLNGSNSNYAGGFTSASAGYIVGAYGASSSGGLAGGPGGIIPNGSVTAAGVSLGASILVSPSAALGAEEYTRPAQLGKFWAFGAGDLLFYAARQVCH
ncbi:MAG: hypothetical protein ACTHJX_08540 [Terriglobales bacterium]